MPEFRFALSLHQIRVVRASLLFGSAIATNIEKVQKGAQTVQVGQFSESDLTNQ